MHNPLNLNGKVYISSRQAAKVAGYASDYIGQLCRAGKLDCTRVGRVWYVTMESLVAHKRHSDQSLSIQYKIQETTPPGEIAAHAPIYGTNDSLPPFQPKSEFADGVQATAEVAAKNDFAYSAEKGDFLPNLIKQNQEIAEAIAASPSVISVENSADHSSNPSAINPIKNSRSISSMLAATRKHFSNDFSQIALVSVLVTSLIFGVFSYVTIGFGQDPLSQAVIATVDAAESGTRQEFAANGDASVFSGFLSSLANHAYSGFVAIFNPINTVNGIGANATSTYQLAVQNSTSAQSTQSSQSSSASAPSTSVQNPVAISVPSTQTIIEKIVSAPATQSAPQTSVLSDIDRTQIEQQIQDLDTKFQSELSSELASLSTGGNFTGVGASNSGNAEAQSPESVVNNPISNVYQEIALSQNISQLSGTAITNPTITGGTISGATITGSAIDSDSLSANSLYLASTTAPGSTDDTLYNSQGQLYWNGSPVGTGVATSSPWNTSGNDIYYTAGNVGIGTTSPSDALSVGGDELVAGNLIAEGNLTATGTVQFAGITGMTQCLHVDANGVVSGTGADCGSSGGGAVNEVSNSDNTLTISPTSGVVVASLNLAHANIWTGAQAFTATTTLSTTTATQLAISGNTTVGGTLSTAGNFSVNGNATTSANGNIATQGSLTASGVASSNGLTVSTGAVSLPSGSVATSSLASASITIGNIPVQLGGTIATSSLGINSVWGNITGTLSNQTDLQNALNAKLDSTLFGPEFYTFFHATTTDALAEGLTNLYFTNARAISALTGQNVSLFTNDAGYLTSTTANSFIAGSSTIPKTYTNNTFSGTDTFNGAGSFTGGLTANSLSVGSLTGLLLGTGGTVSSIATSSLNLSIPLASTTGTLAVGNGGTGWNSIQAGGLLYGNGTGSLATTTQGAAGQVLAFLNGIPTWTATTTYGSGLAYANGAVTNTGLLSFAQTYGTPQSGAITFATSSATSNGLTSGITITNSSGAFTVAPSLSGILAVSGGGTGTSTAPSYGQLLLGNALGGYSLTATSSLGLQSSITAGTGLSLSGTTLNSVWTNSGSNIYNNNAGNVGIGTTTPFVPLSVNGSGFFGGTVTATNITATGTVQIGSITGTTQCLEVNSSGVVSGAGSPCGTGSGSVNSVSNSDNTLTISPTSGVVVASLNLGNANTWTAAQTFNSGLTANSLSVGSLTGLLLGTGGTVSSIATSSLNLSIPLASTTGTLAVGNGGTGTSTAPSYGNILVGNSTGGYSLTATSSLGLQSSITAGTGLSLSGTTLNSVWTNSGSNIYNNNAGNVGIGTSSPWRALSVSGSSDLGSNALAGSFTATSTVASTFPYASTTALSISGSNGLSIGSVTGLLLGTNGAVSATATSSLGLLTTNVAEGTNLYFTNARAISALTGQNVSLFTNDAGYLTSTTANSFIAGSSTIPKTYTNNTFSGTDTFNGAGSFTGGLTANALTLGTLNGPLQANNGVITSTSSVGVLYGGTGLSTAPSYGQLLLGNALGGYTLTSTSSLGLLASSSIVTGSQGQVPFYNASGNTLTATSSLFIAQSGNIGIGTTSPWATLSVTGNSDLGNNALAGYFTATSTTATSTFPELNATDISLSNGAQTTDLYNLLYRSSGNSISGSWDNATNLALEYKDSELASTTGLIESQAIALVGNYFYAATSGSNPAIIEKLNVDTMAVATTTMSGCGEVGKLTYDPNGNNIYAICGGSNTVVIQVNPSTLANSLVASESYASSQPASGATDGTYLYVLTSGSPAYLSKYLLSNMSLVSSTNLGSYGGGHDLDFDGTNLYATSFNNWVAQINPSTLAYTATTTSNTVSSCGEANGMGVTADYIYLSCENQPDIIRVQKSNLNNQLAIPDGYPSYTVYFDGKYLWIGTTGDYIVRMDPVTQEMVQQTVPEGAPNKIVSDGERLIFTTWTSGHIYRMSTSAFVGDYSAYPFNLQVGDLGNTAPGYNLTLASSTGPATIGNPGGVLELQPTINMYNPGYDVGIGTSSPSSKLSVEGDGYFSGNVISQSVITQGLTSTGNISLTETAPGADMVLETADTYTTGGYPAGSIDLIAGIDEGEQNPSDPIDGSINIQTSAGGGGNGAINLTDNSGGGINLTGNITLNQISSAEYYNGTTLVDGGGTLYYDNGGELADAGGSLYYGDNQVLADSGGDLYFGDGTTLASSDGALYYASGNPLTDSSENIYYGNGSQFVSPSGTISYNNGTTLADTSGNLYTQGKLGVASSTPWASLSIGVPVYSASSPMFAIGSSTANGTTTPFIVAANGNVGIGTTSPYAALSVIGKSDLGNSALAGYFTSTTTTASTFPYASTTALTVSSANGLSIGSLTGLLVGTNGSVSSVATSSLNLSISLASTTGTLAVANGGTGTSTAPSYGNILVGNSTGGYTLTATSSLGLQSSFTAGTGLSFTGSTLNSVWTNSGSNIYNNNAGNVGIGTSSPYAALSVVGQVVGSYFTATSTIASTFPYASTTALTVSGANGLTLGSLNGLLLATNGAVSSIATSSLGLLASSSISIGTQGQIPFYNASGNTLTATSSLFIAQSGNIGIGTTSPYAALSVNGQVAGSYFTATSNTATSTFAIASSTTLCIINCVNGVAAASDIVSRYSISEWGDSQVTRGVAYTVPLYQMLPYLQHNNPLPVIYPEGTPGNSSGQTLAQFLKHPERWDDFTFITGGATDGDPWSGTLANYEAMTAHLSNHFIVLGINGDESYTRGTSYRTDILAFDQSLLAEYPNNSFDEFSYLFSSCVPLNSATTTPMGTTWTNTTGWYASTTQDQIDCNNGVLPTSLRDDTLHLNASAIVIMAKKMAQLYDAAVTFTPSTEVPVSDFNAYSNYLTQTFSGTYASTTMDTYYSAGAGVEPVWYAGYYNIDAINGDATGDDNFGWGVATLANLTSGYSDIGLGRGAGRQETTAHDMVAIGNQACTGMTSGNQDVCIGSGALSYGGGSPTNVVAIGTAAGQYITGSQDDIVAIGYEAFTSNGTGGATGGNDIAIGKWSQQYSTTGTGNITIGFASGGLGSSADGLQSATYNTFLGYQTNLSNSFQPTNLTLIGSNATGDTSNTVILGSNAVTLGGIATSTPWATWSVPISSTTPALVVGAAGSSTPSLIVSSANKNGNVGIGTSSPYALLSVAGQIVGAYITATTTATSTFGGGLNITSGCFAVSGTCLSSSANYFANSGATTTLNTGSVVSAGVFNATSTTATSNFAGNLSIGGASSYEINNVVDITASTTLGSYFFGAQTGNLAATGIDNTALGDAVMWQLTTGDYNDGVANNALWSLTSGSSNSSFGFNSLYHLQGGSDNVGIGAYALFTGTGENYNIGIGHGALGSDTADGNIGLGYQAGNSNTTGTYNLFLGYNAGNTDGSNVTSSGLTEATAIGYDSEVQESNALTLGGTGSYAVNVGIGTTTPDALLSVQGKSASNTAPLFMVATSSATATSTVFMLDQNGILTVNDLGATSTFNGNVYVHGTLRSTTSYNGDLFFANNFSFTEAPLNGTPQGLILKNQNGTPIMNIDEDGNLSATGDICSYTGTTTSMGQSVCLSSIISSLTNATSSPLLQSQSFIGELSEAILSYLNSIDGWVFSKIQSTLGIFTQVQTNTLQTQTASITDGLEMTDQVTGQVYCVTIQNGSFDKEEGSCGAQSSALPQSGGDSSGGDSGVFSSGSSSSTSTSTPPIISINGDNPAQVALDSTYNDLGARVIGPNADLNLGIATSGTVDTTTVGTYTIVYTATDQNGLTSTSTRTVNVYDPNAQGNSGSTATTTTDTTVSSDSGSTSTSTPSDTDTSDATSTATSTPGGNE